MPGLLWLCIAVVFSVALPVAVIEVWIATRFKAEWGGNFPPHPFWGKPTHLKLPGNVLDVRMVTPYHGLMFGVAVPSMIIFASQAWGRIIVHGHIVWLVFMLACWLGVSTLEDFLYFVLHTTFKLRFPQALQKLFRGEVDWHPRWLGLYKMKLHVLELVAVVPDFYVWGPMVILLFLYLNDWIAG